MCLYLNVVEVVLAVRHLNVDVESIAQFTDRLTFLADDGTVVVKRYINL